MFCATRMKYLVFVGEEYHLPLQVVQVLVKTLHYISDVWMLYIHHKILYRHIEHSIFLLILAVPTLSISTDLLVSQYVDGEELNGMSPELTCAPSDSRAPVQWSTLPVYVDLEQQYSAQFVPPDLNQTLRFPAVYERLPRGTLRLTCDLINIEEPGVAVDPVDASVIFTQSKAKCYPHLY